VNLEANDPRAAHFVHCLQAIQLRENLAPTPIFLSIFLGVERECHCHGLEKHAPCSALNHFSPGRTGLLDVRVAHCSFLLSYFNSSQPLLSPQPLILPTSERLFGS